MPTEVIPVSEVPDEILPQVERSQPCTPRDEFSRPIIWYFIQTPHSHLPPEY